MKRLLLLLVALSLTHSLAIAQIDPDPNGMGVYFDTNAITTEYFTAGPFQPVIAYLVVTNPTSPSIAGWECKVDVSGPAIAQSWSYAGGGLNVFDPVATGLFNVGVGVGPSALMPVNDVVVLATWSAFIISPVDVVTFTVRPFPGSVTFADAPGYVDGNDVGLVIPCGVSSGRPYGAISAAINFSGVVPAEGTSWGRVKALYD